MWTQLLQDLYSEPLGPGDLQSCPQCRQSFRPRPALVKNIMLAGLVEQVKTRPIAPPADHCSQHKEVKKMFCRTDQQLICSLCSVDQHKGHDIVSAATERAQRQGALESKRPQLLQSIQDNEIDLQRLQQEAEDLRHSAQDALQRSGERFTQMALLLEVRRSEVEQQIRSELKTREKEIQEHQEELQQNITEINKTISEIDTLSLTEDHNQFMQKYHSLSSTLSSVPAPEGPRVHTGPSRYFEEVTTEVAALIDELQLTLNQGMTNISSALTHSLIPEPSSRQQGLRYSKEITLDPNTANGYVSLSEGNRRSTITLTLERLPDHPDRFKDQTQVLSREALTGRCYWEVECKIVYCIRIAVSYKSINRSGSNDEAIFGNNEKSWALEVGANNYSFWFNNVKTEISGPMSSRIGVYLDHHTGALCFYSIEGENITRLHKVTATFTEPLYAGVRSSGNGDTVTFLKLK